MLVILIKDVSFQYLTGPVTFAKGQSIYVDVKTLIAFADGIHFEVSPDEFAFLQ